MDTISKLQPVFIIAAALIGLALGSTMEFGVFSSNLIEPFLMVLLFSVFLSVDGKKFKEAFLNLRFTLTATCVNFVWTPLFGFALGLVFFGDSPELQMGLMMLLVTPCTDWYLVFTGLARGNVVLGASILPLNLLLQIVLMPIYLLVFYGSSVQFEAGGILVSILMVLAIPFVLAFALKSLASRIKAFSSAAGKLRGWGDNLQLVFLCLAVVAMFASQSVEVFQNPALLARMFVPLIIFFALNLVIVRILGNRLGLPYDDVTALNFTTLARNSPLSLAIAIAAFPEMPLISLALVIGPLIELPALAIIASILKRMRGTQGKSKA